MSPRITRQQFKDGSFVEGSVEEIEPDRFRPHGVRHRIVWVQDGMPRVLFDNHHGKADHCHIDGVERPYAFVSLDQLMEDFLAEIRRLGGKV